MSPTPNPTPSPAPTGSVAGLGIVSQEEVAAAMAEAGIVPGQSRKKTLYVPSRFSGNRGTLPGPPDAQGNTTEIQTSGVLAIRDAEDVQRDVRRMSGSELDALARKLVDAGVLEEDYTRLDLEKAWENLVGLASDWYLANPDSILTPEDMIDLYGGPNGRGLAGGAKSKPSVRTVVDKQVDLSSADDARAMLERMLYEHLGRRPTGREADDFQAALNEAQRKNPATVTTTTNYDAEGYKTGSSATRSGGFDAGAFAESYAREGDNEKEYAQYQAATTYFDALMAAIKGV